MKRLLLAAFALIALPAFAQTTFTVEQSTTDGKTVTPRLTWSTNPVASSCVASGAWSGTKAPAGTEILAPISSTQSYTITCNWAGDLTARVTWTLPTTFTDGTPYASPGGSRIVYGTTSTALDQTAYVNSPTAVSWVSPTLAAGKWYFAVRAVSATGLESDNSNVASKTLTAGTSQARTFEAVIKIPSSPSSAAAN